MAEVVLPAEMQYFPPAVAARARAYRQTVNPINGPTFTGSDKMKFVLGTTPGTYLNLQQSYLEFDIQNTAGTPANAPFALDTHACCFFERIEIYHAGALLDTVNNVNVLYNLLMDASVSYADQGTTHVTGGVDPDSAAFTVALDTTGPSLAGTIGSYAGPRTTGGTPATDTVSYDPIIRRGRLFNTSNKVRVCLPLLGLFSPAGLQKYLPLGDAVNGNVEIHVYLASTATAVARLTGASAPVSWALTDCSYQAQLVEIDAAVHAALIGATGGVYSLPYNSYRHYGQNMVAGETSKSIYISTKVSSMSAVIVSMRPSAYINNSDTNSISFRVANLLKTAQLRVGALNFPLTPLKCDLANSNQALVESLKIFGKLGTMMGGTSIRMSSYVPPGTDDLAAVAGGQFFIAFDTQAYSAASAAVDDGLQAQHGSTYLQLEFLNSDTQNAVIDVWVMFDGMLTVANGAISAAF